MPAECRSLGRGYLPLPLVFIKEKINMNIKKDFVSAGSEYTTYASPIPAPLFKLVFDYKSSESSPFLEISALGFYDAYINGKRITKGLLAPYISNPEHYIYYDRYDIQAHLIEGKNTLCIILANGFVNDHGGQIWDFDRASFRGVPALAFCLFDGEKYHTAGESLWKRSAVLYDDYRCGVVFDARLFDENDFTSPSLEGDEWQEPTPIDPSRRLGELRECTAEPIRIREELIPISVRPGNIAEYTPRGDVYKGDRFLSDDDFEGGYIADFGKISAGTARLRINGRCGQRISLRFAEILNDSGDIDLSNINFQPNGFTQRAIYICKGGEETFEIPFTYYGCRYCHIHGADSDQISTDTVTMLSACSAVENYLDFSCSNDTVNRILDICRQSDLDNFYYFPTDCPQREKNGWTGDASESCEHMLIRYGVENSFDVWIDNILMAQADNGSLPGIVPTGGWGFAWGNGPAWDRVLFNVPYMIYKYTGKLDTAKKCTAAMYKYLVYVDSRRKDEGTLEIGLGDYCQAGRSPSHPTTPIEFTDSAVVFDIAKKARFLFELTHAPKDYIKFADDLASSMRRAIRDKFLDRSDMSLAGGTQTAQAYGISYDIFDEAEMPQAASRLLAEVENDNCLMNVGFLGSREIFSALTKTGNADVAFAMIMNDDTPSYANIVRRGFTALPERFDTATVKERTPSFDHHFYGDVSRWIVENILGLSVDPYLDDANAVMITPRAFKSITKAEGKRKMPQGEISVSYTLSGDTMILKIVPKGETKVYFDFSNTLSVEGLDENTFKLKFDDKIIKGDKLMKKYTDFAVASTEKLMAIDSPGSYTANAISHLKNEFEALGCKATVTNKGGLLVDMGGKDESNALLLEAHTDTLGGVVCEIKSNGRLKISPIGGLDANNTEGENCKVITKFDGEYEGTFQLSNASVHVNRDFHTATRTFANMEVVLDEDVSSPADTKKLGISVGDIVVFDPRFKVTKNGYIKSRFLDDKLSVGIVLAVAKYLHDNAVTPERKLYAHITVYEEVGHGGSASVPNGTTEGLSIDMGCVGDGITCTEKEVSICAKDAGGPYNYEMTKSLIAHAKRLELDYAVDVYPFYGSDVEATLRGGNDIRHALIGPGVYASHGYERSHVNGVENTIKLLLAYIDVI